MREDVKEILDYELQNPFFRQVGEEQLIGIVDVATDSCEDGWAQKVSAELQEEVYDFIVSTGRGQGWIATNQSVSAAMAHNECNWHRLWNLIDYKLFDLIDGTGISTLIVEPDSTRVTRDVKEEAPYQHLFVFTCNWPVNGFGLAEVVVMPLNRIVTNALQGSFAANWERRKRA